MIRSPLLRTMFSKCLSCFGAKEEDEYEECEDERTEAAPRANSRVESLCAHFERLIAEFAQQQQLKNITSDSETQPLLSASTTTVNTCTPRELEEDRTRLQKILHETIERLDERDKT